MSAIFDKEPTHPTERLFRWFRYSHLQEGIIRSTSKKFHDLANEVCSDLAPGPERTVALRKLLEAKDAAVRSAIETKELLGHDVTEAKK